MTTYNRIDLMPDFDFCCPVLMQDGVFVLLPDDHAARKEFNAFIRKNKFKTGLLCVKITGEKKIFEEVNR